MIKNTCSDFARAIIREWLETNGIGGYASSTIIGANTRGYHGLLIAATRPPLGRMLMVSKMEEALVTSNGRYEFSCNQYPGAVYPEGYKYQKGFRIDPFPIFTYKIEKDVIEKSVFMVYGENTTVIAYKMLESSETVILEIRPIIAGRDFHGRMHENPALDMSIQREKDSISIAPCGIRLFMRSEVNGVRVSFESSPYWYRNFEYAEEIKRGQEGHEDLYSPGYFVCKLSQNDEAVVVISTDFISRDFDVGQARQKEIDRRASIISAAAGDKDLASLMLAADQFIVKRGGDSYSIIAGYHWFGDWGRDTMIALPGLTLVTKRYHVAKEILKTFAYYCDKGMIPNRFPEVGKEPEYNTVDASLWFVNAVNSYLDYTSDVDFIKSEIFHVLTQIIHYYANGTRYNIHADSDGLIYAGEKGTQLTWMDAKIGDLVVTPRRGKAVEINALWYNALKIVEEISSRLGEKDWVDNCSKLAQKVADNFDKAFWNETDGCLYDYVDGQKKDTAIRPNQIFALSLPYPLLTSDKAKSVLKVVQKKLLIPFGLRSLSPDHKDYKGYYAGDSYSRDIAYHQGTAWAWLLGHFISACLKVNGYNQEARGFARKLIDGFLRDHLLDAGVGNISEIFDGNPPHSPRGCVAQAWSVAEILRVYAEVYPLDQDNQLC